MGEVRQRRGKTVKPDSSDGGIVQDGNAGKSSSTSPSAETSPPSPPPKIKPYKHPKYVKSAAEEIGEMSMMELLFRHPFIRYLIPLTVVPYLARMAFQFVWLQKPHLITGLLPCSLSFLPSLSLLMQAVPAPLNSYVPSSWKKSWSIRPAVNVTDERQLLIVGMSNNLIATAEALSSTFPSLEIGYDTANANSNYVRDGTVSNMIGLLRYLPPPGADTPAAGMNPLTVETYFQSISQLCNNATSEYQDLQSRFHPYHFRSPHESSDKLVAVKTKKKRKCSTFMGWSQCWKSECVDLLLLEWGCAWKDAAAATTGNGNCDTPYRRTLYQMHHPFRTIENLLSSRTFCVASRSNKIPHKLSPSVAAHISALFPHFSIDHDFAQDSCLEGAAWYTIFYHTLIMNAIKKDKIHGMYRYEDTSVCEVAKMAGLNEEETTVWTKNHEVYLNVCGNKNDVAIASFEMPAMSNPKRKNEIQRPDIRLTWTDLHGGNHGSIRKSGDLDLHNRMKKLFKSMGYDPSLELKGEMKT